MIDWRLAIGTALALAVLWVVFYGLTLGAVRYAESETAGKAQSEEAQR